MELNENSKNFTNEEINKIKEISNDFYEELNPQDSKIITKTFVFNIFFSLVFSIPISNIFDFFDKNGKNNTEKWLQNVYDDYLNIPKKDFSAKDLKKRTESRFFYYEKAFKLRAQIQNMEWTYHNLDKDVTKFIQGRENTKLIINKVKSMEPKKEYIQCYNCSTKFLIDEKDECPRCKMDQDLSMFIKLSNIFCILGDMETFYNKLDKETTDHLINNWDKILRFFEKKRIKRNQNLWCQKRKEYGLQQYNKIIKLDGGDWGIDPDIKEFNRKYDVALLKGFLEIDLRNAKNANNPEFIKDLNMIHFPLCTKLYLPPRNIIINDLRPNMLLLNEIHANNCNIKEINLDAKYFPRLTLLFLENNKIEKYINIEKLINIKTLRVIDLHDNPIVYTKEIYISEKEMKYNDIEIRYNYQRKINPNKELEIESDEEIIKLKKKYLDWKSDDSDSDEYYQKQRNKNISFK